MNKRSLIILFVIVLLLLGGCAKAPAPEETAPQRVAVLFSSYAEVFQLAGGTVTITVGESVERGICGEEVLLVDGGAGKIIDTERLLSYRPDLVIGSADIPAQAEAAELLEKAGIPCKLFRVETFSDYLSLLKYCTDLTGNPEAYRTYGTALQAEIDTVLNQRPGAGKKILLIRSGSSASSAKAKTAKEHFAAGMLAELGCTNLADAAPILTEGLSVEEILLQDPDHIFIATMGNEQAAKAYMDSLLQQPAWASLRAVQNKNYTYLSKDLFQYKPNHRWAEAYRILAEQLHES